MTHTKKPSVVLVHGMWSVPEALSELREFFEAQGYEVYSPRLPHHYPKNEMTAATKASLAVASLDEYMASVVNFIQSLDDEPILLGHSMGALIAQLVAARVKLNRLILVSSAAPAGINGWSLSVVRTVGHNLLKFPLWKTTTNLFLRNIQYGIAHTQSAALHKEITRTSTFDSGRVSTEIGMWFLFRNPSSKVEYHNISCPVLIVAGTEDRITPISIQRKIFRNFKGQAILEEIQGCDHWTVGGKFFPEISIKIQKWLGSRELKSVDQLKAA